MTAAIAESNNSQEPEYMEDKDHRKSDIKKYLIIATYTVLLYLFITNLSTVRDFFYDISGLLNPVILGIGFAYVLNILLNLYEQKVFHSLNKKQLPLWEKLRRTVSILLTYITMLVLLAFLAWFILPQLFDSLAMLTHNIPTSVESFNVFMKDLTQRFNLDSEIWTKLTVNWNEIISTLGEWIVNAVPYILTFTKNFTTSFIDVVMGLMLSVYLLFSKENIIRGFKKLVYAFASKPKADKTVEIGAMTNKAFSGFIAGQLTEALILGVLCFIGMTIFSFPYALLISVIIAVTSVIPIFGAYIGTIPSAFIIMVIDPPMAIWFIVFIIVLQQIEGNFIYPRVVGNSIGLSGVWVILSLMIGGGLFGLMGMILGIPAFAVIYALLRSITANRLKKKNIKIE